MRETRSAGPVCSPRAGFIRPDRVHRSLPAGRETVTIFGPTWVALAHESQLSGPNSFRATRLGLRPVIVTRGGHGEIHALLNRCTHRGATVYREEFGRSKNIQRHTTGGRSALTVTLSASAVGRVWA